MKKNGCIRTASVLLVDKHGRLLMQLRDENAPTSRNMWAIPGGRIEAGESADLAAKRELFEETGVSVDEALELFWHGLRTFSGRYAECNVYCAATQATSEDIVLGEGADMKFLAVEEIESLPLAENMRFFIREFLESEHYRRIRGR
ncbi:NUDIX hydrolase [Streptomyces sp. NPDC001652]|uniref:NUDIX hydrolase n=1 Tax=Streptomyces sp. NPDC001652 TaxID=3154393 RepID=UPI00331A82B8